MKTGYAVSAPQRSLSDLRKELENLSVEERELLHNDMYGFATETIIETDELIQTSLDAMERMVQDITVQRPTSGYDGLDDPTIQCYIRAYETNPSFVLDSSLRIKFLRCELFNVKNAVIRFVTYWKERVWLWGEERAFRKISIDDFDHEDQVALQLGGFQVCPSLDKFQRGIIVSDRNKFDHRPSHRKSQIRQLWYILEAALDNVVIQKNGIVIVLGLRRSSILEQDRKLDHLVVRTMSGIFPIRCVAIHHFVSNKTIQFVVPFLLYVLGSRLRKRYKCHTHAGGMFEILQRYGIFKDSIPQNCGGTHPTYNYTEWLESRRIQNL